MTRCVASCTAGTETSRTMLGRLSVRHIESGRQIWRGVRLAARSG